MTASPRVLTVAEALDTIRPVSGGYVPGRLTLCTVIRNERYFIGALLDHYRRLGVEQFAVLDDGSVDGTREFLAAQPDCAVFDWGLTFGEMIEISDSPQTRKPARAGVFARDLLPRRLGIRGWAVNVDGDEFLLLPPGTASLPALLERLDAHDIDVVHCALMEFYPAKLWPVGTRVEPLGTAADAFETFPFYDGDQVFDFDRKGGSLRKSRSASSRLFSQMGIRERFDGIFPLSGLIGWLRGDPPTTPSRKSPLIRWRDDTYLKGSHHATALAPPDLQLAAAHFKFTPDLDRRTELALRLRSYAGGSRNYTYYERLLMRMRERRVDFANSASVRYSGPEALVAAGIMKVGDRFR